MFLVFVSVSCSLALGRRSVCLSDDDDDEQECRWQPQTITRQYSSKQPLTLKLIEERVILVLNLYDKIDASKVKNQLEIQFKKKHVLSRFYGASDCPQYIGDQLIISVFFLYCV